MPECLIFDPEGLMLDSLVEVNTDRLEHLPIGTYDANN